MPKRNGRILAASRRRRAWAVGFTALFGAYVATPAAADHAVWRTQVVVPPSTSHGFNGMKFIDARHLLVGDVVGFSIWRIDVATGEMTAYARSPQGGADDLAIRKDGLLAWTALVAGVVYGQRPGGAPYVIASGLPNVNSLGFDDAGRLFATQLGPADTLFELDPTGRTPPRALLHPVHGLNGFRIDQHDVLWGPRGKTGEIIALDLKTLKTRVVASGFVWPTGVDIGPGGILYVVDLTAGTLSAVDPDSGAKRLIRQLNPGTDNLTVGPGGLIYVSNSPDNSIVQIDPASGIEHVVRQGSAGVVGGLAVVTKEGRDAIFLGDTYSVLRIDAARGSIHDIGRTVGSREIRSAISVRAAGRQLVLSHFNAGQVRLVSVDDGATLRTIDGLDLPYDAVLLSGGDLLVAESGKKQITRITAEGARSVFASGLVTPVGLALDKHGGIFVTDAGAGALVRIDLATGERKLIANGLSLPEGVDVAANGDVIVAEAAQGRVDRIDPRTGARRAIATGLALKIAAPSAAGPIWIPAGVGVGSSGEVYVSEPATGAVLRFYPDEAGSLPAGRHLR